MKIITNKLISEQKYDMPKILPNNLKLIKINYGISISDIANALDLNRNFVGNVVNEKVNFSGLSVIKFIKHFNVPFNLIYSVNKEVTFSQTIHLCYISIYQLDKDYPIYDEEKLNSAIINASEFLDPENTNIIQFIKKIENNSINYTDEDRKSNHTNNLNKYQEVVSSLAYDYDKYNYFAMAYEIVEAVNAPKYINLQENIDVDLIRYLDSKDFISYKYKSITIPKKELSYNEENKSYKLPQTYELFINDEIVMSDTIKESDCILKRTGISINIVSDKVNEITKLKHVRKYKNYSTKDMADKLLLSEETYIAIEKGYQKMSAKTMWKIELEFGVFLNSVLNIEEYYKKYCID